LLAAEVERLKLAWKAICAKAAAATAPACLWRDEDALAPVLRDHADSGIESITVASAAGFSRARAWLALHAPELADRLRPRAAGFPREEFEEEFARALAPTVKLGGGGMVRFDEGWALTAIDVDSAGDTAAMGREGAAWGVNREAADEIARQLRLRAVGGAVVVDFLRLSKADARARLLTRFRKALADDPARCRLLGFTRLGLVELTRRRRGPSLSERWFEGRDGVPGPRAAAHVALMQAAAECAGRRVKRVRIACAPAVALAIEGADRAAVAELVGAPVATISAGADAGPAIVLE
jgi:Rne/Rng family ribonuclease